MVAEGARVVLADIDGDGVASLAEELGAAAVAVLTDVTDEAHVARAVARAVDRFGRLDVLHNNAVTAAAGDLDAVRTSDDVWRDTFSVVVMAAVYGCRHAIPAMLATGGGAIVNTSSGAARTPTGTKIAYGSTKAALETFTVYTAAIHGHEGIRANVVAPGFVLTPGTEAIFDAAQLDAFGARAAAGRVATPEDVAEVVVFLASDAAAYVSGQVVAVNGGGARPMSW
jgi:NAD(P)-dependent dehydrogenase (short-subunit alcohol dehydrogenase family)